jgi:hypothetical protein
MGVCDSQPGRVLNFSSLIIKRNVMDDSMNVILMLVWLGWGVGMNGLEMKNMVVREAKRQYQSERPHSRAIDKEVALDVTYPAFLPLSVTM